MNPLSRLVADDWLRRHGAMYAFCLRERVRYNPSKPQVAYVILVSRGAFPGPLLDEAILRTGIRGELVIEEKT